MAVGSPRIFLVGISLDRNLGSGEAKKIIEIVS
jgi:hypothetical protein